MVSEQIMVSSRFVLPDPLGPPTSTCGDTSASSSSRGSPSTNPTGAQSALRESRGLSPFSGRSRSNVAARVRHLSCSSAMARQASITSLRGSGGSGTTVT